MRQQPCQYLGAEHSRRREQPRQTKRQELLQPTAEASWIEHSKWGEMGGAASGAVRGRQGPADMGLPPVLPSVRWEAAGDLRTVLWLLCEEWIRGGQDRSREAS